MSTRNLLVKFFAYTKFRRQHLVDWEPEPFQALDSGGITYKLRMETHWLGSWVKTHHTQRILVPHPMEQKTFTNHWDRMIKDEAVVTF